MKTDEIERNSKKIMDDFLKSLEKVDDSVLDLGQKRKLQVRNKTTGKEDKEFKKRFIANTPQGVKDGLVVSDKKKW